MSVLGGASDRILAAGSWERGVGQGADTDLHWICEAVSAPCPTPRSQEPAARIRSLAPPKTDMHELIHKERTEVRSPRTPTLALAKKSISCTMSTSNTTCSTRRLRTSGAVCT